MCPTGSSWRDRSGSKQRRVQPSSDAAEEVGFWAYLARLRDASLVSVNRSFCVVINITSFP